MSLLKKFQNNKTLLNGGLFSLFSFFNQGIAFLLLILLANYIAPAEYGKLSLFNTIVQFLGFFIALSTQGYLSVSFFKRGGQLFHQDFTSICVISVVVTAIICLICIVFGGWIAKVASLTMPFIWMAIIISFFQLYQNMLLDYQRVLEKIGVYGIISCGSAVLNFILSIYLITEVGYNWEGRVYAQILCVLLFGGAGLVCFIKKGLFTRVVTWEGIKKVSLWGVPLIPHLASVWLKQGGDRFIINHFHSVDDVGVFSFALNLTSVIIIVGTAFNSSNSVSIFKVLSDNEYSSERKKQQLKKQTRIITMVMLSAYFLIIVCAGVFVPLLLPQYSQSIPYFYILSVQGLGQCFYLLFCNYLFYYSKNKQIMYVTFFTAAFHLCLSLMFTRYSLYLTCIIYVITQSIVTALVYSMSQKVLKNNCIEV